MGIKSKILLQLTYKYISSRPIVHGALPSISLLVNGELLVKIVGV